MDLKMQKLSKHNQEKTDHLNSFITINKIDFVV